MDYLLDPHSLLWLRENDKRLNRSTWEPILFDARDRVHVSVVTLWEIAIKRSLGKLELPGTLQAFSRSLVIRLGFKILPVEVAHLSKLEKLPFHHRDPFDRLLIAQAAEMGAVAVTDDPEWRKYPIQIQW